MINGPIISFEIALEMHLAVKTCNLVILKTTAPKQNSFTQILCSDMYLMIHNTVFMLE